MELLFTRLDQNRCKMCDSSTLVFVDERGNFYNYSQIVDKLQAGESVPILDQVAMDHIHCCNCGRDYKISWRYKKYPQPIYTNELYWR